jgi:hypothetical protein
VVSQHGIVPAGGQAVPATGRDLQSNYGFRRAHFIAAQGLDQADVELAVPASVSFGVEMDGGRVSITPHGLVGARFVLDDGVDPRLDVGFGLALRVGPIVTGAALFKQGNRDQQRGVLHAGIRF